MIAETPAPPYYAVVFTTLLAGVDADGYQQTARAMEELAAKQPGFLGLENARTAEGFGITVSYWRDRESIRRWKANAQHAVAQQLGRNRWYASFRLRVCLAEDDRSSLTEV